MSLPNVPGMTPNISLSTAQTVPLLLASIALEELALAHILNAEAEKLQFVLGTLTPARTTFSPATVSLSNLLVVNSSIQRTLGDVIKKEMLLEFKFENVLDLISMIPPPVETFCECGASFIIPANSTIIRNGTETGTGRLNALGTVQGRVMICNDCNPAETDLFQFEFTSLTTSVQFLAATYDSLPTGELGTCCFNSATGEAQFMITGTGTRNGVPATFELVVFEDIVPPIGNSRIQLILNGSELFEASVAPGNGNVTVCPGFILSECS
ncbi:hypothetical protein ACFPA1_11815 [Neobacillus sp. GCM10023253]|uniref:hypothetical protein n=1 Tax=Neobacillus sp. GCM10023253 TaxID=3252644 RepID=UPI003609EADE